MRWLLVLMALFSFNALAADLAGTWKGTAETPNGTVERTFVFKQDGTKITGETSSDLMGRSTITDGKLDGDTLTFTINVKFQDQEVKLKYTGKVAADQIKFSVETPNGGPGIQYTAKKVS